MTSPIPSPKRRGKIVISYWIIGLLGYLYIGLFNHARAAALLNVSDVVTTTRPSVSTQLTSNQASNAAQVIIGSTGTQFLQGDITSITAGYSGEVQSNGLVVATQSGQIVMFTAPVNQSHRIGDMIVFSSKAMHTISFSTVTTIPVGGRIVLTFPILKNGDNTNPASPSASTFELNGLSDSLVKLFVGTSPLSINGTYFNPIANGSPVIYLYPTQSIPGGSRITIYLGCNAATSKSCTGVAPTIINPTKTKTAGTSDIWTIRVRTQDNSSTPMTLDESKAKIATVESVQVLAIVIGTFTFSIKPIPSGTIIDSNNIACTGNIDTVSDTTTSTANSVNLGKIPITSVGLAAQDLIVTTNGKSGYAITATSSGHLINTLNGFAFADSITPAPITAGKLWFGIHPCGKSVDTSFWGTNKYGWPTLTDFLPIASQPSIVSYDQTTVEYGATADVTAPGGIYTTGITYMASPMF